MVEAMVPDRRMVHVMCQAGDKIVSHRDRWNLSKRDAGGDKETAKQSDVQLYRRELSISGGVAINQQVLQFAEKIVANANQSLIVCMHFDRHGSLIQHCKSLALLES